MSEPDDDAGHADTVASDAGGTPAPAAATAPAAPAVTAGPGVTLGRYQLGAELGAGGMATVYRARDRELRRDVAVKVLFPHLARKPEVARRFHREARAAAALEHPNILRVYDVGGGDAPYIVMELVRGASLRDVAEADGPLLAELAAAIGALLCDALAAAHAAGVIHRDVKPGNVLLADDGRLLLADFGVARLDDDDSLHTRTGALLGTPSFMAPEQAHGDAIDARADLYAVGVTLYQLATGALPFSGPAAKIVAEAQRGAAPAVRRRPAVGAPLSRLIAQLMEPDPARRPATATAAAALLRALVTAGGLGDPADEVRAFAADRAGYQAARLPAVLAAVMADAEAAARAGATARALAACDRALALAPEHAGATALVARLTSRGQRRRLAVGGALAVAVAGGAVGGYALLGRSTPAAVSPGDAAAPIDATTGDAAVDATTDDATTGDAAIAADGAVDAAAAIIDARASDAGPRRDAGPPVDAARPVDAAAPPVDAAAPPVDAAAPAAPGAVVLVVDTWCDLTIDGEPRGRATAAPYPLAPGPHQLTCKQGLGQGSWTRTVTVHSGATETFDVAMLAEVAVTNGLADAVRVRDRELARGATAGVRPGRVRLARARDGAAVGWVTIPQVPRCTLRAEPELACYP